MMPPRVTRRIIILGTTTAHSVKFLSPLVRSLHERGWECHLVCGEKELPPSDAPAALATLHHIPMKRQPSPLGDLRALILWVKLMRKVRPEVLFVGSPKASLLGVTAAKILRVPHRVYLIRGLRFEGEKGLKRKLVLSLEALTAILSTRVLSVSQSVKRQLEKSVGNLCREIEVLGSGSSRGVDTDYFRPRSTLHLQPGQQESASEKILVIGYVGRLARDKGILDLLESFAALKAAGFRVRLLIAGPEEGLELALSAATQKDPDIEHINNPQNLLEVFQKIDVFCFPSYREGLPNVVLEASSCGIPIVAADVTGVRDAVIRDRTGLLVPARRPDLLAEAITKLLLDQGLRSSLGRAGREFVISEFGERDVVERYTTFLDALG